MLKEKDTAPDFSLPDEEGNIHTLSQYRGRWVLLYFYPKDDTPGCTKEACAIRDVFPRFETGFVEVFGVSKDSPESHRRFKEKYHLPFHLLSDKEGKVVDAYYVSRSKVLFGKSVFGIARMSFLIDPKGVIRKVYEKVRPEIHAEEVLEDLARLSA